MKSFFAALGFLTVLPVPARWTGGASHLRASVAYFPLIGLMIGLTVATFDRLAGGLFPASVTSVLTVVVWLGISGGLHIDGLADTADGFFGAYQRERALAIMKDSRSGPLGVVAVVLLIALKLAALTALPLAGRWGALLLAPLAGRSAMVLGMSLASYARPEGGTGLVFAASRPWRSALAGVGLLALAGWAVGGWRGLVASGASVLLALAMTFYSRHKIGGWTGDTLGATCEIAESIPALVLVAHLGEVF
jgi:adenosylcobinamide-GDP ribazoletransferase